MDSFKQGWFTETRPADNDQAFSLPVDRLLHQSRSKFQDILVFDSKLFGRTLVLDNCIQCTEKDECAYQEMIAFLPLNCHPKPAKVLIVGGGDGGVAREVVKHSGVESVVQCEIDREVIEVCKQLLPFMAKGFESPKVTVHVGDGLEFVSQHREEFDVIITDSPDPVGPAEGLFQKPYYENLKKALRPGGILCSQGESYWYDLQLIKNMVGMCRTLFPVVDYASVSVPSYPGGQIGFLLCSLDPETDFRKPKWVFSSGDCDDLGLRFYSKEMHEASFALPNFVRKELRG